MLRVSALTCSRKRGVHIIGSQHDQLQYNAESVLLVGGGLSSKRDVISMRLSCINEGLIQFKMKGSKKNVSVFAVHWVFSRPILF